MWSLTPTLCTLIPSKKAKEAVLTLTDYKPNPERDNHIIEVLKHDYSKVFFGLKDIGIILILKH